MDGWGPQVGVFTPQLDDDGFQTSPFLFFGGELEAEGDNLRSEFVSFGFETGCHPSTHVIRLAEVRQLQRQRLS